VGEEICWSISGNKDVLATLPDARVLPGYELNVVEKYFQEAERSIMEMTVTLISIRCATYFMEDDPVITIAA